MAAYTVTRSMSFAMALIFCRRTFVLGAYPAFTAGAGLLAGTLTLAVMLVGFLAAAAFRRLTLIGFWTAVIAVVAGLA
ncbi:MAG: hypothetical protein H5T80_12665, partial [Dietzia sp.]|nr:hypothetical protein [Dietzia sp.]